MAAGTAFAISYQVSYTLLCHAEHELIIAQSDLSQVTMENLVVFSVAYK